MSRELPELPDAVLALAEDIQAELLDPAHVKRLHGKRNCYTAGCRGPLCLRSDRIFNRERYAAQRAAAGKKYRPDEEVQRNHRDDELDAAIKVYMEHSKAIEVHVRLKELYEEIANGLVS